MMIMPRQTNVLMPQIYSTANKMSKASNPPPRYQMYWAFSPRNSIGLLMPLLMVYTDTAIFYIFFISPRLREGLRDGLYTPKKERITVATTTRNTQLPNQAAAILPVSGSPLFHLLYTLMAPMSPTIAPTA